LYTDDRTLIFVKVPDNMVEQVGELFGSIKQDKYSFVILPLEVELLTRKQVEQLIKEIPSG